MATDKDPLVELGEVIVRDIKNFLAVIYYLVVAAFWYAAYAVLVVAYPIAYFLAGLMLLNLGVAIVVFLLSWSMGSFLGFEQMQPTISNPVVAALGGFANWAAPVLGPVGIILAVGILAVGWLVWQFIAALLS